MDQKIMEIILNSSPNGIFVIDGEQKLTWFNEAAEAILKKSLHRYLGLLLADVLVNNDLYEAVANLKGRLRRHFNIGDLKLLLDGFPLYESDGRKVGTALIFQDISHYELVAEELTAYQVLSDQLNAVIDCSYDGIYITDGDANTLRVNKAYERITGIRAEEVIGRNMRELVDAGYFSQSVTLEVLKRKKVVSLRQKLKTGKEILVTGSPIYNEAGDITLVVNNNRDITELTQLWQELERKDYVNERYRRELEELRQQLLGDSELIVKDLLMLQVLEKAKRVAPTSSSVLLLGETGTGKEVMAKYIHRNSRRYARGSFVQVSCAAIPETLLESELFGYEKGAFTGASREGKVGLIELADGGTLFLDEIGELPLSMQVKLLRVLQEQEFLPLGGSKPRQVDMRVIVATNRDLMAMVDNKKFREDLFYRINVIPLEIPPLRQRPEDIIALAIHFLKEFNKRYNLNCYYAPHSLHYLSGQDWPGNVRQLRNQVERAVLLSANDQIGPEMFMNEKTSVPVGKPLPPLQPLQLAVARLEKSLIEQVLRDSTSNKQAAAALGIDVTTLWRKMKRHGIVTIA